MGKVLGMTDHCGARIGHGLVRGVLYTGNCGINWGKVQQPISAISACVAQWAWQGAHAVLHVLTQPRKCMHTAIHTLACVRARAHTHTHTHTHVDRSLPKFNRRESILINKQGHPRLPG